MAAAWHALLTRPGIGYGTALSLTGITLWASLMVSSGALTTSLWPTYDAAGMVLQWSNPGGEAWWTGHHSNIGLRHPGPTFLLLGWLGQVLHQSIGLAASSLGAQIGVLAGVKTAMLVMSGALVAAALRSRTAGLVFLLAILCTAQVGAWDRGDDSWSYWRLLDFTGRGLQATSAAATLLLMAAALAWAKRTPWSAVALVVAGGLAAHVHTAVLLPGLAGMAVGIVTAVCERRRQSVQCVSALTLAALFLTPFAVRLFQEPGWPLTYLAGAEQRYGQRAREFATDTDPFLALGNIVGLPGTTAALVLAACVTGSALMLRRKSLWREAAVLGLPAAYCLAVAIAGPDGQPSATELMWTGGLVAFAVGLLPALFVASTLKSLTTREPALLPYFLLPLTLLAAGLAGLQPLTNTAGPNGVYVTNAADSLEAWARKGNTIAWELDEAWLETSAGILLELQRRGVRYCVTSSPDNPPIENPSWFFPPDTLCRGTPTVSAALGTTPEGSTCVLFSHQPAAESISLLGDYAFYVAARDCT